MAQPCPHSIGDEREADAMWRCPKCGRSFQRSGQSHSCRVVGLDEHFTAKPEARALFDRLLRDATETVGPCEVVPLKCCIHLSADADFLAVLPKRDRLEVRFALPEELHHARVTRSTRINAAAVKHSVEIAAVDDIDDELRSWIRRAHQMTERLSDRA
jgi:hypothetical protein